MPALDSGALYAVVFKDAEEDVMWRCTKCGASGHGGKSMARHTKRGCSKGGGVRHQVCYVPEKRYQGLRSFVAELEKGIEELRESLPPSTAHVFDDDDELQTFICKAVDEAYMNDEATSDDVYEFIPRLVWNPAWWDGLMERWREQLDRRARDAGEHAERRSREHREYLERELPRLRERLEEVERELGDQR
jgi:hypothetical protein